MRQADPEPEVTATLEAIDATLAGEPVDPAFAETAELALLLRAERPVPKDEFARALDRRVGERFKDAAKAPDGPPAKKSRRRSRRGWWWTLAPAGGLAAAAVVVVVVLASGGGTSGSSSVSGTANLSQARHAPPSLTSRPKSALAIPAPTLGPLNSAAGREGLVPYSPILRPPNNGRKQILSSQLTLGAEPNRIDTVAQEAFNVVGEQNGFVNSSEVTAGGAGGYAHLQLTVPSITLPQTMGELSTLPYARVLSRTDTVEDVTSQYREAVKDHNKAQVRALQRKVAYSQITLNIQADAPPPPFHRAPDHDGFTITGASHTALHVLTVIGGVGLIALAVVVPIGLVAGVAWWIAAGLRRRRRERALDLA